MASGVSALLLLCSIGISLAVHILTFTLMRRFVASRRIHAHAVATAPAVLTVLWIYPGVAPIAVAEFAPAGIAMAICNAYVLFHFDNMGETGRRIRILRDLRSSPAGLSRSQILEAYPPREVFNRRLRRLKEAGQCYEDGGRLRHSGRSYSLVEKLLSLCGRVIFTGEQRGR